MTFTSTYPLPPSLFHPIHSIIIRIDPIGYSLADTFPSSRYLLPTDATIFQRDRFFHSERYPSIVRNIFDTSMELFQKEQKKTRIQLSSRESIQLFSISLILCTLSRINTRGSSFLCTFHADRVNTKKKGSRWSSKTNFIKPLIVIVTSFVARYISRLMLATISIIDVGWFMKQRNFERLGCLGQIGSTFSSS